MIKIKGITISEKLEAFLRKEKVYTRFCNNVNNPKEEWANIEKPHEIDNIIYPFIWELTPEGEVFWNELYTKFKIL